MHARTASVAPAAGTTRLSGAAREGPCFPVATARGDGGDRARNLHPTGCFRERGLNQREEGSMKLETVMFVLIVMLGAVCLLAGSAHAVLVDVDAVEVGTVVAGETPAGVTVTSAAFDDFLLTVENHGDGPHSLVVCQAVVLDAHPDGNVQSPDYADHLMMVAADIVDDRPRDGRVDLPACEKDGGRVVIAFRAPVNLGYILLGALDTDLHDYVVRIDGEVAASVSNGSQWTEPGIFVDLDGYLSIEEISIELRGAIGIAQVAYFPESVAVDEATWGAVKALYR